MKGKGFCIALNHLICYNINNFYIYWESIMKKFENFESLSVKYSDMLTKTLRVRIKDIPGNFAKVATAIGKCGALLGDIVTSSIDSNYITRDITIFVKSENILENVIHSIEKIKTVKLINVIDAVLNVHIGGKIAIQPTIKIENLADLRKVYTPGVANVSKIIQKYPKKLYDYTYIGNTVAIVTNGTAVLGLGNIGVKAALPVMEGKSVLFKKFADINAIPILIDSEDIELIINTVVAISPSFGAIQLEDIKAPECFEIERKLIEKLNIPVFHDDQHGTAIVVLAAMMNALKKTKKDKRKIKVVINGAGAAGIAISRLLIEWGIKNIILCDRDGAIYEGRKENMNNEKISISKITNIEKEKGSLKEILKGKDIFIGVSGPNLVSPSMIRSMNKKPICFALANPIPEISPKDALKAGAVFALDGKSLNNALAFPGVFKGALKARAKSITTEMKLAAAEAIAKAADEDKLIPNQLDLKVHNSVAKAVYEVAKN